MGEVARIADQHARAFSGPAWHGPAMFEVLKEVGAHRASARPLAEAHTIWEIVLHVATWEDVVARRLAGERVEPTNAEDWPAAGPATEEGWREALVRLERRHADAARAIAALDDGRLDRPVAGGTTSAYALAHGAAQHAIYHAGQIALLKRAPLG